MDLVEKQCIVCENGGAPLAMEKEVTLLSELGGWEIDRRTVHKIRKQYREESFRDAIEFVNKVARIAEEQGHHPDIHIKFNKVTIELYTHAVSGLSENDFIMAARIDALTVT